MISPYLFFEPGDAGRYADRRVESIAVTA